jgi:ER-bound oxygenase mpaB/B'/Rubber oxygenase, catalytic domain
MRVLRDMGLMAGYQAGAINQTLVMTGTLEKGAARRIAETTKWRMVCSSAHGLDRFSDGFKDTVRVRMIHALVRHHVSCLPDWDAQHHGLPINQIDMQVTYLAFSVIFLLGQRIMGTVLTQEEAEDVMHLWRYIGWLMGVDEEWLCDSEQAGRIALYRNLLSQAPADESSMVLGRALMEEPLQRHYPGWRWLKGHWNKQVHLSICRLFVGQHGMRNLGLPMWVLPWYPLVFAPLNFMWCGLHRALPGGRARLIAQGRRAQWQQLQIMFGPDQPEILAMGRVHTSP